MNGGGVDQVDVLGIYLPTFVLQVILVFLLLFLVRWLLDRFGILALFWHRGLVEVGLYMILLGFVVLWMSGTPLSAVWAAAQLSLALR